MQENLTKSDNSENSDLKWRQKKFIEAFIKSGGNISIACKEIGISRETYYEWSKSDTKFNTAIDDVIESNLDFAESVVLKAMAGYSYTEETFEYTYDKNGVQKLKGKKVTTKKVKADADLALKFLELRAKHRGYIRESKIEHSGEIKTTKEVYILPGGIAIEF